MRYLIAFSILLFGVAGFSQTPGINFASRVDIETLTGGDPYTVSVRLNDCLSRWTANEIAPGDSLYLIENNDLVILVVTSTPSVSLGVATFTADDPNDSGIVPTGSEAAILRPTDNFFFPLYICNLRDDLQQLIDARFRQRLDNVISNLTTSDGDKGDITVSSSGAVWDIDPDAVGSTEIDDASITLLDLAFTPWHAGNDGSGSGLDADLLDGVNITSILQVLTSFGGDVSGTYNNLQLVPNAVGTTEIAPQSVTYNRIQNVTNNRILGRYTAGSGTVEEISIGSNFTLSGGILGLTGAIPVINGGTGFSSYTVGDLLYADGTNSLAKLAGVATGNALISGGVGTAPAWGKIGLTTHVSGTLPIANGGTGLTALGTALQLLRVNAGATALEYFSPSYPTGTGTSNTMTKWTGTSTLGNSQITDDGTYVTIGGTTALVAGRVESAVGKIINPGGGVGYVANGSNTGSIEISIPALASMSVANIQFDVKLNSGSRSSVIHVNGYVLGGGSIQWTGHSNVYYTSPTSAFQNMSIRLGHEGGQLKVWIGELATVWSTSGTSVSVENVVYRAVTGSIGLNEISSGWTVTRETSAFGTVNLTYSNPVQYSRIRGISSGNLLNYREYLPMIFGDYLGSFTGAMEITLPPATANLTGTYNFQLSGEINFTSIATKRGFTIHGQYNYATRAWANTGITWHSGRPNDTRMVFRFGDDGTRGKIWIGDISTSWTGSGVWFFDLQFDKSGGSATVQEFEDFQVGWGLGTESTAFNTVASTISALSVGAIDYAGTNGTNHDANFNYSSSILSVPNATLTGLLKLGDGTAGAPALTFTSDTDGGLWRPGTNIVAMSAGGLEAQRWLTTGTEITGTLRFSSALLPNNQAGTSGQVLTSAGAGSPPTWTTLTGTIGGSIAANQVGYGTGTNTLGGDADLIFDGTTLSSKTNDAGTTTVTYPFNIEHSTSSTAAAGFGVGYDFKVEDAAGNLESAGMLDVVWTDATNASEDADFVVKLKAAGAAAAEKFRVSNIGQTLAQSGTASNPSYSFNSDNNTGMYLVGSSNIRLNTGGATGIDINSSQLVGIGMAAVTGVRLAVNGQTRSDGNILSRGSGSTAGQSGTASFRLLNTTGATFVAEWLLTDAGIMRLVHNSGNTAYQVNASQAHAFNIADNNSSAFSVTIQGGGSHFVVNSTDGAEVTEIGTVTAGAGLKINAVVPDSATMTLVGLDAGDLAKEVKLFEQLANQTAADTILSLPARHNFILGNLSGGSFTTTIPNPKAEYKGIIVEFVRVNGTPASDTWTVTTVSGSNGFYNNSAAAHTIAFQNSTGNSGRVRCIQNGAGYFWAVIK